MLNPIHGFFLNFDVLKQTMNIFVLCIILLCECAKDVMSKCEEVASVRFSKEFEVVKEKDINVSLVPDCLSGIILKKKLDSSLYCISKQPISKSYEKLTCIDTDKNNGKCDCGIENPPPSSRNRIFFPTG